MSIHKEDDKWVADYNLNQEQVAMVRELKQIIGEGAIIIGKNPVEAYKAQLRERIVKEIADLEAERARWIQRDAPGLAECCDYEISQAKRILQLIDNP